MSGALPEQCCSILPSTGELIVIKRGERGYYRSEWNTDSREENKNIADFTNSRMGITLAQLEAMICGSMCGWDVPGAQPQFYLDRASKEKSVAITGHIKHPVLSTYFPVKGKLHTYHIMGADAYYAVEIEAPEGYKLDDTPHYFEVVDGKTSKLTVTNKAFSGILIHKTDSSTGKGIYGVTFLLYDANNNPVGQYTSDNQGYVYIENIETGRYYLRELENEGYILDTQRKTVYVKSGETTLVEWENTPIMGQIQIIKKSADDNPINALPAGTLLEGAVFEVYDKAGNVVDTIVSDYNGRAVSKLLPLGRYTIREVQAPDYYSINPTVLTAYLDYEGQIVTFEVEDNSVSTGVSIKKTGYAEVMPNQPIRYTITGIGNTSTVPLSSFYWRDTLPGQVQLSKVVTGTYNQQLSYKIVYKTNLKDSYQTLADSLSTTKNYVLEASPAALGLASNERVTEIMFVFGTVKGGFGQVETAYIHGNVVNGLANGSSIVNVADVGGVYNGQWIQAVSRWVTKVYAKTITTLPKTGY